MKKISIGQWVLIIAAIVMISAGLYNPVNLATALGFIGTAMTAK